MPRICFGIKELNQYFDGARKPGTAMLIVGYPGTGKTILAATIAYNNCLRRVKVLYMSFFEHLERFMS